MNKINGKKRLAALGTLFILLCILLIHSFISYNDALIRQQQQQLLRIVRSVSHTIEAYIENQKSALDFLVSTDEFKRLTREWYDSGSDEGIQREISDYLALNSSARAQFLLVRSDGRISYSLQNPRSPLSYAGEKFPYEFKDIHGPSIPGVYLAAPHSYLLPIITPAGKLPDGSPIYASILIDFEDIYRQIDSTSIKADEKSYLIVKDQSGYILLHESRNQVGLHAINGRAASYPDVDFTDMNRLISKELEGKEDTYIFDSYWFSDDKPLEKAKKFSAFTPLTVDYGFWVVSINMDYNAFIAPFNREIFFMILVASSILLLVGGVLLVFIKSQSEKRDLILETEYLRELNSTLDELNKTKEKTRHSEKLQMMGIMTGGIAHEFNNILSPVMGYSELLLNDLPKDSLSHGDAEEIFDAACRARDLVRQISELSQKDTRKVSYSCFDLSQDIQRWLKSVELMRPDNVTLTKEIDGTPAPYFGNSTQLYEVLLNLCTNAFHAMKENGGSLTVSLRICGRADLPSCLDPLYPAEEYVLLTVSDTGCGMDENTLANMFTPFFTTKKHGTGTGLGLSIAQGILEEHRGAIGAQSVPGEGTRISTCVPLSKELPENQDTAIPTLPSGKLPLHSRILLVDDDPSLVKMLTRVLQKKGFQTDCFQNPLDALNCLRENQTSYGILITDYTMDPINGVELASQARVLRPQLKIILISGMVKKDILNAYKQELIQAYLTKPVKVEELLQLISGTSPS